MTTGQRQPPSLLTPREAAEELDTTTAYLAQLRYERRGPEYIKLGKEVRYERQELARYASAKDDRSLLSLSELATWWGVSLETIYSLRTTTSGLPTHRIDGRVFVKRRDADRFLRSLTHTPMSKPPAR